MLQTASHKTPNRILWTEYSPLSYSHWKLINCSHSLDRKILFKLLNFVFQRSRFSGESICWRIWRRVGRGSGEEESEEESVGEESSSLSASFESSYSVENFWLKLKISNRNFRLKALSSFFRSERKWKRESVSENRTFCSLCKFFTIQATVKQVALVQADQTFVNHNAMLTTMEHCELTLNFQRPSGLDRWIMNQNILFITHKHDFVRFKDKRRSRLKSSRHRWITREILSEILTENSSLA